MERDMVGFAIGTDIVEVERIIGAVNKFGIKFLKKIFSKQELDHCRCGEVFDKKKDPKDQEEAFLKIKYWSLAVRFAAKEAFSKAVGLGIGVGSELDWQDVAVQNKISGEPELILSKKALEIMRARRCKSIKISLSHSKTLAQAVVVLI